MAHEITERANGEAEAFFAGNGKTLQPAWHGLGTNVLDAPNSAEAIRLAKLDWQVLKVGAAAAYPSSDGQNYTDAADHFATVREDNGFVLGFVGSKYQPVQNHEAFDFLDNLNADGIVKYESAGSLKGGRVVWVLARTHTVFDVAPGDAVQPYILFSTSHDGSTGVRVLPTTVRVVCANTLRVALGRYGVGITLKHDGTIQQRLKAVRDVLSFAIGKTEDKIVQARALVAKRFDKSAFQRYMDDVLPVPEDAEKPALRLKAREHVAWNFYRNPRQNLPGIERTAWAAYNAVSEFADHAAKFRSAESRFVSVIEGGADELKQKAFDAALSMV